MIKASQSNKNLQIGPIDSVSPSLVEILQACKLRAGLSRIESASRFVLGSPKAWIGIAYHEVFAALLRCSDQADQTGRRIYSLWDAAVTKLYNKAQNHPLDFRFGLPSNWLGYHLTFAMLQLRAKEIDYREFVDRENLPESKGSSNNRIFCERRLVGLGGKIVGRPDVIHGDEIVDYKTGELFEHNGPEQDRIIKASYVRQLRLYAFLVKEALGWWPRRGILISMAGEKVELCMEPSICEEEAFIAVSLLDHYNSLIDKTSDPLDLASPNPEGCKWCPYKLICQPFWINVAPDWSTTMGRGAIEGDCLGPPKVVHYGSAISITIDIMSGTARKERITLSPLNNEVHSNILKLKNKDRIRVVNYLVDRMGL